MNLLFALLLFLIQDLYWWKKLHLIPSCSWRTSFGWGIGEKMQPPESFYRLFSAVLWRDWISSGNTLQLLSAAVPDLVDTVIIIALSFSTYLWG